MKKVITAILITTTLMTLFVACLAKATPEEPDTAPASYLQVTPQVQTKYRDCTLYSIDGEEVIFEDEDGELWAIFTDSTAYQYTDAQGNLVHYLVLFTETDEICSVFMEV